MRLAGWRTVAKCLPACLAGAFRTYGERMAKTAAEQRSDEQRLLVGRARQGDFEAFEQLVVAHQGRIHRFRSTASPLHA